jgi:alkylated DNA repair dioxygenase AlkB
MNKYREPVMENKVSYLDNDNKKGKIYFDTILSETKSIKLYNKLLEKTPWVHGVYKMFGKEVKTPRLLWAMKDDDFDIEKSYSVTGSSIWTKEMEKLKTKVEKIIKKKIKYAQINYYRNGNDYIGWHTDSEVVEGDLIASISLGATRKFQFQAIDKNNKDKYQLNLTNGSLIVFDYNAAKKDWKHRIPKEPKVDDGRINITFRLR